MENGKIKSWSFQINDFDKLELAITIEGAGWGVRASFHTLENMEKLFNVLEIVDINQLTGSYCRVEFIDHNLLNTIYNIIDDDKYYAVRNS